jgi:hypothetical protein
MDELNIEKFDPTKAELQKIATAAHDVIAQYKQGTVGIDVITETRKQVKAARVRITKTGKELREDALKFQRAVISKEKELIEIIEPVETAMSELEKQIEREQEIARMKLLLPVRRSRMASIGYTGTIADDELNAMSVDQFETRYIGWQQEMNAIASQKLADERAAVEAEARRQAEEKEARERDERIRREERERLAAEQERERIAKERAQREEADRIEREAKEKADRIVREAHEKAEREAATARAKAEDEARIAREKREADERARQEEIDRKEAEENDRRAADIAAEAERVAIEQNQKYQAWVETVQKADPEAVYRVDHEDDRTTMWKLVGTFSNIKITIV